MRKIVNVPSIGTPLRRNIEVCLAVFFSGTSSPQYNTQSLSKSNIRVVKFVNFAP